MVMTVERRPKAADMDLSKGSIGLQNHHYHHQYQLDGSGGNLMTRSTSNNSIPGSFPKKITIINESPDGGKRAEYRRSLSSQGRRISYLSLEGLFLLICLAASLLLLPLILPPLPPPPFMLLLLPICILVLLMILAFMPSSANARDIYNLHK